MSDPLPCREQIVAAIFAIQQSISELPAERNRKVALEAGELPRQILFEGDEEPDDSFTGQDGFRLPLLIQVAIPESGADAATASNIARAKLQRALQADRTLGGKASNIEITEPGDWIGVDVNSDDAEGFIMALTVSYATVEGDPFTFS